MTFLHLDVAAAGVGWLALGMAIYPLYRRRQGLDLTTTTKVAVPKPVVDHEAEYESVLVALDGREYSAGAMATAIKLAARRRRGIHVLVTITVPQSAPIGAQLPEQELAAQAIIEQAKLRGGRRVSGHWEKVRAGQAGRLIVREAREMRAQAIVLPLPRRGERVAVRQDRGDGPERAPGAGRAAQRPRRPLGRRRGGRGRRARRARGGAALMPAPRNLHSGASQVLSGVMVLLGVAILVSTIARGGGPLALGVLLGVLFVAAGVGRLYVERARGR